MPAWPKIWMLSAGMLFILSPSVWAANLALIIGNNQYGNGIDSLANPINDAQAIDAQLKRLGFQTTLVKNADKIQMLEAIDDFSQKINRGDTVLFFYAGHGASVNGNNYLIPSKAAIPKSDNWMDEHFVDLDTKVASRLSQSPASYKLVVMDACRDNPIALTRSSGTRAFARTDVSQNAAGLSFLYSASKGQQAQDGRGGNSPFTTAFINKLKVPNLKWPELVDDVAQDVRQQTKNQQEVWQEGNTLARFVLNAQAGVLPQQQVEKPVERIVERDSPHAAEIAAWDRIKSSSRASDYQSFLRSYPSGLFAEAAQLKLSRLEKNNFDEKLDYVQMEPRIFFAENDSTILPQFYPEAAKIYQILERYPSKSIVISAHTDNKRSAVDASKLSLLRAEALKALLVERFGVGSARITTKGMGFSQPIASNATTEGRAQNTRLTVNLH